jgi:predicted dehydrogenase
MLAEVRPDILCVATRQTMHADQIEAAVQAGVRGVLCDKPLATTLAEADRIVHACRHAGVPLAFGLDRRWSAAYRTLRLRLEEGAVGTITGVVAYGLPNLINHGCHTYDTALALAGDPEPEWVSGLVRSVTDEPPESRRRLDPSGRGHVGLANGAHLTVLAEGSPRIAYTVTGTHGLLVYFDREPQAYLSEIDPGSKFSGSTPRTIQVPASDGPWPAGPAIVRDLAQAVQSHGSTACDVDAARRATEIGFAIHASSLRDGARVPVPVPDRSLRIESFPWGNE